MTELYGVSRRRLIGEWWFWIALVFVTVLVIGVLSFGVRWLTAEPKGRLQAREQIQSGANRIAAYEHFYNLCAAIQAQEAALAAQYTSLDGATGDDKERIKANIAGLTAQRARSIAQYNVDARKSYTQGQFRSSDLPYEIDASAYPKGVSTSCVA